MTLRRCGLLPPIALCLLASSLFFPPTPSLDPKPAPPVEQRLIHASPAPDASAMAALERVEDARRRQDLLVQRITSSYKVAPDFARRIVKAAHDIGRRETVDPVLLLALVGVESSFRPEARNPSGAIGLTQTIPRWHPQKVAAIKARGKSLMDPEANLGMGAQILAEYTRMSGGDRMRGLQRYNGASKDRTQRYARKVMATYHRLGANLPAISVEPEPVLLAMEQTNPLAREAHPLLPR